jgi:hypothetical protein
MDFPNNFSPTGSQRCCLRDTHRSNPAKNVQARLFGSLVFLALALSTPGVWAQTGNRASASLRVTVNLVPAIQAGLAHPSDLSAMARTMPMPAGGLLLLWPERWIPFSSTEEVRKLSESPWASAPPAFSAETHAEGDGRPLIAFSLSSRDQGHASAPAQGTVELRDALVITHTVVPQ